VTPQGSKHAVPQGGSALRPAHVRDLPPPPDRGPTPGGQPPAETAEPVTPATAAATVAATVEEAALPPPPPAPRRHSREQFNTKIRIDLRARLDAFVERHQSTLQGVLEAALDEYMARRGWTWEDHQRAARRR
jgi:hypothetical protein